MQWPTNTRSQERGQASIEILLIFGAILVIVISVVPAISRQAELNRGIAAARDGATFGASMRGMGFYSSTTSESNKNIPGVIKIDRVDYTITDNPTGVDDVSITIYVRGPAELKTTSVTGTIRTETQRFIGKALSGSYDSSISARTGEYYKFSPVSCNFGSWIVT